jgi:energy-coupling factor transporter ATP-binding protein EcfA2
MIRNLSVAGFKSIRELDDLPLGRVNVLIGANGSGKSNLLEAVGLLSAAASGRVDDESLMRRGVRLGRPRLYKSAFREQAIPQNIGVETGSDTASYKVNLFNPIDAPEPAWRFFTENLLEGETSVVGRSHRSTDKTSPQSGLAALKLAELPEDSSSADLVRRLSDYRIFAPVTDCLRGFAQDSHPAHPVGLAGGRLAEAAQELLDNCQNPRDPEWSLKDDLLELIGWADDFYASEASEADLPPTVPFTRKILAFQDKYIRDPSWVLTGYDASEGALYVLFAAVLALHPEAPRILSIDNFDHALNPRLARALIGRLCDWTRDLEIDRQLILTCHNPLVLDALPLTTDPDVRLFTADRDLRGMTTIRRVEVTPELMDKAKEGWTLSRLWVMGHLGGVPDV